MAVAPLLWQQRPSSSPKPLLAAHSPHPHSTPPKCRAAGQGFHLNADVALVGTPLSVLDADLSFEVRGPAKSAAEAKKQQLKYAAAKEARRLLGGRQRAWPGRLGGRAAAWTPLVYAGERVCECTWVAELCNVGKCAQAPPLGARPPGAGLSLPQAQVLAELFRGRDAVLELPHSVSIFQLIALQRHFDGQPQRYAQLCQVSVRLVAVELGVREPAARKTYKSCNSPRTS